MISKPGFRASPVSREVLIHHPQHHHPAPVMHPPLHLAQGPRRPTARHCTRSAPSAAPRTSIEHHVHQPIVEQVDFIDIQDAPIGTRQQPRLVGLKRWGEVVVSLAQGS